jgi:single-stranded-DNA-specific exonuclease
MKKRIVQRSTLVDAVSGSANKLAGVPEFLERIYLSRGIQSTDELALGLNQLIDAKGLKGVDEAVELLYQALLNQDSILVVGDFDCDGATSTALAVDALRAMGAAQCDYLVPNRFKFGYGLTPGIVDLAMRQKPDLIVTVDNGIASHEGVQRAIDNGIKVLITDHHLPGEQVPPAHAIVNPNQHGCEFGSKNAAGVGVIFYVLNSLRAYLRQKNWFEQQHLPEPNMGNYLDLVALGTVADLVPLDRNNRVLVEQGLKRIRAGRCRPGITALLAQSKQDLSAIKSSDLGFIVGPRLNAAGRLDDMSLGIECLLAQHESDARALALKLDQLNQSRKEIEREMKMDAESQLSKMLLDHDDSALNAMPWGLCLFEPHWHQGVIGILASRVKEKLHRPVIAFAPESDDPDKQNGVLKGSARSISGFHMRDARDLLAKRHPELLSKCGGHAMAAGMSIEKEHFDLFCQAFDQVVREQLTANDLEAVLYSDGQFPAQELTLENVQGLELAGPWGQKFPEPSFDGTFEVVQTRILKELHLKLVLKMDVGGELFDAIQFNSEWVSQPLPEKVRVVYRPNINEFRGRRTIQFMVDHIEAFVA